MAKQVFLEFEKQIEELETKIEELTNMQSKEDGSELDLTEDEFKEIAVAADAITKKCRWDKIYLLCPHGVFVDDHTRYMAFSGTDERKELFEILCNNIKTSGDWDKVTVLDGGYWNNFKKIVDDVKEIIENGKMD